jgi:fatty-acyl-CoA synthase
VTNLLLFSVMLIQIFKLPDLSKYDFGFLRFALVGGERIDPLILKKFQKRWPHTEAYQVYGLTEGSEFVSILDSEYMLSKAGSIGRPFFNVNIRLLSDDGKDVPVGEVGEILNQSPVTRCGYWKNPEATADVFADGWCRTGDLGRVDEDGFLWIVGRKKEMIRSAGENIYAAEVENVISSHPAVSEVAVYPVPDPVMTESVMASVALQKGCSVTSEELIAYCKQYIASYKKPRYIEFMDSLPRTPSNKVMKYILQERNKNIAKN